MPEVLLRRFGRLEDAEMALEQLIGEGLLRSNAELRSLEDEAGPVEGNFTVGNGRVPKGAHDGYELNFADSSEPAANLLVVQAVDEEQRRRWALLLDRLGGTGVGPAQPSLAG